MLDLPDGFIFPAGWQPKTPADVLERELRREVCKGHPLFGVECRAIAFGREEPDDVLFLTDNPFAPLAFVHLTWRIESDPAWPHAVLY